jgi:aerobic carbon-monoxide dehydrogenase small subunit
VTEMNVSMTVNGENRLGTVEPRKSLADFLRDDCGLTGTHLGCEHGVCGACTIMLNGRAVRSCLVLAVQADGAQLTTIEGLAENGELNPVQQAFRDNHGLQCGFCTPGMMLVGASLLERNPSPTEEEIRWAISGNICRCTGYMNIVKAIQHAAHMREASEVVPREQHAGAAAGGE